MESFRRSFKRPFLVNSTERWIRHEKRSFDAIHFVRTRFLCFLICSLHFHLIRSRLFRPDDGALISATGILPTHTFCTGKGVQPGAICRIKWARCDWVWLALVSCYLRQFQSFFRCVFCFVFVCVALFVGGRPFFGYLSKFRFTFRQTGCHRCRRCFTIRCCASSNWNLSAIPKQPETMRRNEKSSIVTVVTPFCKRQGRKNSTHKRHTA